MSKTIKPALTREEWDNVTAPGVRRGDRCFAVHRAVNENGRTKDHVLMVEAWGEKQHVVLPFLNADRHALAALALHQQPFGFTREDVAWLREMVDSDTNPETAPVEFNAMCLSLAARIEALLPPEGP